MAGTEVTFHWWATNWTVFGVWDCWGTGPGSAAYSIYWANGTNGSSSFEANGDNYVFGTLCGGYCDPPATVAGTYFAPVLAL